MFKSHYVNGNAAQKMIYKQLSNKLTKDKANAKKLYYEREFQKYSGNSKKTWDILKTLLPISNKTKKNNNFQDFNPQELAQKLDQFNNFFYTIGEDLGTKISAFLQNNILHI